MRLFYMTRVARIRSGCLCIVHVWFPLKSEGCCPVSKLLNEYKRVKGGSGGSIFFLFSAGCLRTIIWQFYPDERLCLGGEGKKK